MQKKILVPTKDINSWKELLADPHKHWQDGRSAKKLAEHWNPLNDFPQEVSLVLNQQIELNNLEFLQAIPEYIVELDGKGEGSHNDLFILGSNMNGLTSIMIEAKVTEPFDKTVDQWFGKTPSLNKKKRFDSLLNKINFPNNNYDALRYQLFHRLASAVIMAEKYHAKHAVMIIQSYEKDNKLNHFVDFVEFVKAYDRYLEVIKNKVIKLTSNKGINIYGVWLEC